MGVVIAFLGSDSGDGVIEPIVNSGEEKVVGGGVSSRDARSVVRKICTIDQPLETKYASKNLHLEPVQAAVPVGFSIPTTLATELSISIWGFGVIHPRRIAKKSSRHCAPFHLMPTAKRLAH